MNKEDIIRMAREAGFPFNKYGLLQGDDDNEINADAMFERFAALVAAAERNSWPAEMEAMERQVNILTDALAQAKAEEREACAKVCEEHWEIDGTRTAKEFAAAIRERGQA